MCLKFNYNSTLRNIVTSDKNDSIPYSARTARSQLMFCVPSDNATYLASVDESALHLCSILSVYTGASPNFTTTPVQLLRPKPGSPPQLASTYAHSWSLSIGEPSASRAVGSSSVRVLRNEPTIHLDGAFRPRPGYLGCSSSI